MANSDHLIDVRFSFSVTTGLATALAIGILTFIYWCATRDFEKTVVFFAAAAAAAGAILSAFYSARALALSIAVLEQDNARKKKQLAFEYAARWNDPSMFHVRDVVRELFGADHRSPEFARKVQDNETNVITFLNFLEEVSYVLEKTDADQQILKELYIGVFCVAWSKLQHWITEFRRVRQRPRMWIGFEELARKWS
jgi:hypothetical protein